MSRYGYEGHDNLEPVIVNGVEVEIAGCFSKDTEEGEYDFYDLYVDGDCINIGEPCYEYPTQDDIEAFLELREELQRRDEKNGLYPEKWDVAN